MANTQNLDLVKPLGTDYALVSVLNSNSDKIDAYAGAVNASLDGLRDGLGILANGNTHAAITSGQYVYVKNHGSLPEGLYKATANIAANGTLSTSNLAADSAGGLNSLNEQIGKLTTEMTNFVPTITSESPGLTTSNIVFEYMRVGKLMFISGRFNIEDVGTSPSGHTVAFTLPTGFSCSGFVGAVGSIALNKTGVDISKFSVRQGMNNFYIQEGAGGSNVLSAIGTGYVMLYATIMLN